MITFLFLLTVAVVLTIWVGKHNVAYSLVFVLLVAAIVVFFHHMNSTLTIDL